MFRTSISKNSCSHTIKILKYSSELYTNRNHWHSFFNFTSTKPVQFSSAIILDDNFWIFFFTVNRKKLWINTICIILVYLVTAHNLCIARPYYPANTIKLYLWCQLISLDADWDVKKFQQIIYQIHLKF